MNLEDKISYLLQLFDKLDLTVRIEPLGGAGGGLCTVRNKQVIFVDLDADPQTRYTSALAALSRVCDLDDLYLLPEIRADLDALAQG